MAVWSSNVAPSRLMGLQQQLGLHLIWWCGCNARIHILCDSLGKKEHQFMSPSKHKVRRTCTNRNVVTLCTVFADSSCWYFHTTTCLITYTGCNTTKTFLQFKVLKCHDHSMCLGYFVICPMIFFSLLPMPHTKPQTVLARQCVLWHSLCPSRHPVWFEFHYQLSKGSGCNLWTLSKDFWVSIFQVTKKSSNCQCESPACKERSWDACDSCCCFWGC